MTTRIPAALLAVLLFATLAACAAGKPADAVVVTPPATTVTAGGLDAAALARGGCRAVTGTPVAPAGPTVLVLTGATATPGPVHLDLAALDALPQVECTVDDRQAEGRQAIFRGPLLADVLDAVGARPVATLHTIALNDYAVDLPTSDVRDLPVLLATRLDGEPMSVAHYGPTRIIYPTAGYDLDPTVYDPRWIWQLSSIDVA